MTVIRKKPFCYKTGLLANEINELRTEEEQKSYWLISEKELSTSEGLYLSSNARISSLV